MAEPVASRIAALAGQPVAHMTPLQGGDLSQTHTATLADGIMLVAKTGSQVSIEADMLRAITATGCNAATVLACDADLMLLEHVPQGPATPEGWAALGGNLRALHASAGQGYGWPCDYAFGVAPIPNDPMPNWPGFWAERRLMAFAADLPADVAQRVEHLCRRLPDLLPATPAPALLHGDLWTGNVIFRTGGGACLIDPACYHGDPEVDLAMLHLFGTPHPAFYDSYGTLPSGWQDRRPAYTLWPALVHLRLFGPSYRGLVTGCLSALGA